VVPASITSMTSSLLSIKRCIRVVSRADERLLTLDRLPERAFNIKALLLMLLEDGNRLATPLIDGLPFKVTDEFKMLFVIILEK
jgi:hypothetical protein